MQISLILFIFVVIFIVYIYLFNVQERFSNLNYTTKQLKQQIENRPIMTFFGDIKQKYDENFKSKIINSNQNFNKQKTLCDDKIILKIQDQILDESFQKVPVINDCMAKANYLCEFTKPEMHLSDNKYFQPKWIFPPYQNQPVPKAIDLNCWDQMYSCCKKIK